jgi:hypothetical protein
MSDKYGVINAVPTYAFIMSSQGNGGTGYAANMTGTTTNDLGYDFIGMGTNLSEPKGPIVLNCCGGIRFYAKSDTPGVMSSFRVKLGASQAYSCQDKGDAYGKVFTVTGSWQLYSFSFDEFQDEGWGAAQCPPQPSRAEALGKADSIQFQSTGQNAAGINLWVDDLYLTNCYPGCVSSVIQPTSTPTSGGPTNTQTPVVPTNTFTRTQTPGGPTNTITPTRTPVIGATATWTPGAVATTTTLSFSDKEASVAAFPNPGLIYASGNLVRPVKLKFSLSRSDSQSDVTVRIYTTGARLVKSYTKTDLFVNGSVNGLLNAASTGNTIEFRGNDLEGLSQGIYFYVVTVSDSTAKNVRSKIEKLMVFKQ